MRALRLSEAHAGHERRRDAAVAVVEVLEQHHIVGQLSTDVEQWAPFVRFAAPGSFYSPIPRLDDLAADADRVWARPAALPGIDLRLDAQRELVRRIGAQASPALAEEPLPSRRYFTRNPAFGVGDATALEGILRIHRPAKIVEIGSGYSSALILDVVEDELASAAVTFVEPYPDLLRSLLRPGDEGRCRIIERRAQDLEPDVVAELGPSDVLFIDSTHVVRTGSDVCHLILDVLPTVRPGVLVHVHDIFWPFELPREWVEAGRQWSECHLLRAFLTSNDDWQIVLFNDYLGWYEIPLLRSELPRFLENPGGSLWLRKVA